MTVFLGLSVALLFIDSFSWFTVIITVMIITLKTIMIIVTMIMIGVIIATLVQCFLGLTLSSWQVVTLAVMVILVTAPVGAAAIKLAGPRFLARHRPSDPQTPA